MIFFVVKQGGSKNKNVDVVIVIKIYSYVEQMCRWTNL